MRPGRFDFGHLLGQGAGLRAGRRILVAVERIHDVVGVERLAVMELHALAQLEGPDLGVLVVRGFGQRGLRREAAVEAESPL